MAVASIGEETVRQRGSETGPRIELLSVERLEERARTLAAELTVAPGGGADARRALRRLRDNARALNTAYRALSEDARQSEPVTAAGDWLLDNFHVIASEIRLIRENMPAAYFRRLPRIASGPLAGEARIHVLAVDLARHTDSRFDADQLSRVLSSFQTIAPLTLGELWAWPSMLTLALLEHLRRLADDMMAARQASHAADAHVTQATTHHDADAPAVPATVHSAYVPRVLHRLREYGLRPLGLWAAIEAHLASRELAAEDLVRHELERQATLQVSVANAITSLRLCSRLDWRDFVENVSLVNRILRLDPAGAFPRMDFLSRDQQRRAVEDIARPTGEEQVRVATAAVDRARRAAADRSAHHQTAHVGYYLVDRGRLALEADAGRPLTIGRRLGRLARAHATLLYLGWIALITILLTVLGAAYADRAGGSTRVLGIAVLLLIVPTSDVATALIQRLVARFVPPRRLPRLDFLGGVPADQKTIVFVPTLLTSVARVQELFERLEVIALANLDPNIHFAILSDYRDARTQEVEDDADILAAAHLAFEALQRRSRDEQPDRFLFFHRERRWNAREGVWMGWERKRGKIEEFNHLLRGATDTSFVVQLGSVDVLPAIRYAITLDSDTLLPRDGAKTLIGIAAHPLNRPGFDAQQGRVTEGYGILQPRVSVTMTSAAQSAFARTYSGHTGVDPYTTAVSDVYQDLFGEGIFTGKGLYDVDAFRQALDGRVPDNTLLSHDLFEGLYARTALVTDVELVDEYPSSVLAHARRQHRWVRGDWQILQWLFPWVRTREGTARNRLPVLARWKVADNLRRSIAGPALLALLVAGWTVLPGRPIVWTAMALVPLGLPVLSQLMSAFRGRARGQTWRLHQRHVADELTIAAAQSLLQLTLLVHQAWDMVHAIVLTLIRLVVTHSRLLEWETADSARRDRLTPGLFFARMPAGPSVALGILLFMLLTGGRGLAVAWPFLALWGASPWIAFRLSRRTDQSPLAVSAEDRAYLEALARDTWQYFATYVGPDDHHLPPDNVQIVPALTVAHRTSATNIGLGLLAAATAYDFGFIDRETWLAQCEATLTTVESLERCEGHLFNWYDTRTLQPLRPAYVSTVDSGNLAGALLTLAMMLRELSAAADAPPPDRDRMNALADRTLRLFDGMKFAFLYDRDRKLFSIGYRTADAQGPGKLDPSHYDLLASEARLASFLAIAKGDVPEAHWFHLGRPVTEVRGVPVLLSWSSSLFEYLMPLLLQRRYPGTLLDESCRLAVRRHVDYGEARGVPWGISESAYNIVDRHGSYQYKAFGIPGLGLKRGLGDDLVVAPYATALAALITPAPAVDNLRRLAREHVRGELGFFDAIDYTDRTVPLPDSTDTPARTRGVVVQQYLAHHQAMVLIAIGNVLHGGRMVSRFHAEPRVKATELLLQERVPRRAAVIQPRPADDMRTAPPLPIVTSRRFQTAHTLFPHTQILSNGRYVTGVTNAGGGWSAFRNLAVTRWRHDATCDGGGHFIYLRDVRSGFVWSPTYHPVRQEGDDYLVTFRADRVTVVRRDDEISTVLDITVSPEDDAEVRRVTITNHGDRVREIELTSYAEVVLAKAADDFAHPAFSKLFLETEYLEASRALLGHRRPRDPDDAAIFGVHVMSLEGGPVGAIEWETDRAAFLGRGRGPDRPVAMDGRPLAGTTGYVLDPIFSLRQRVRVAPQSTIRVCFTTGVAHDRRTAEALAQKYHDPRTASRAFALAFTHAQTALLHLEISNQDALLFERLASRVFGTDRSLRADPDVLAANHLGQPSLWPHGISGDLPIVVVRHAGADDLALTRAVFQAQEYWRLKGLRVDVVVLNEHPTSYLDESQTQLEALLDTGPWRSWKQVPGGIYLLRREMIGDAAATLLLSAARVVLGNDEGDLAAHLDRPSSLRQPAARQARPPVARPALPPGVDRPEPLPDLRFDNGWGGFAQHGRAYVLAVEDDRRTPLPWSNVIANPQFGTIVTASGSAHTWAGNSRQNRLTPFANDPVTDLTSEAIYVRDDDTGRVSSPTVGPLGPQAGASRVLVRHMPGLTRFERQASGLRQELEVFVDADDPIKFSLLTLTNLGAETRHVSVFAYHAWWLGPPQDRQNLHVVTEYQPEEGAVLAVNPFADDFSTQVAFAATSETPVAATGDRLVFIGRNGSLADPAALHAPGLAERFGAGWEPCAGLQTSLTIGPHQSRQVAFQLGQGHDRAHVQALLARHRSTRQATDARDRVQQRWTAMLDVLQIQTPDDSFDTVMNGWLLYQATTSRLWARTGYYQPSGAFGFRDQLQDVMALMFARPDLVREHILRAAARQFVAGDVQHWWHEPDGRGLRTRCSDDRLWLPYVVSAYLEHSGDADLLDVSVPFLDAPPLAADAVDDYSRPTISAETGSLYEHCARAIDVSLTAGTHGLPLIGSGDWNDGMNRVGEAGRGESTWLGFFLHAVLTKFSTIADARADSSRADRYRAHARTLATSLELAWDGAWFRRGYYDDGTPLGSAHSEECQIDSIAQTWAVISGAVPADLAERAIDAVRAALVTRGAGLVLLLAPPFDHTSQDPGYIKAYPPGVRENGGQYTHAALWLVMALARLGRGDEAFELFHMLNPINHTRQAADVERYKAEPYVVAGDVLARPPWIGRSGWTWYTGSAAWMYRIGIESLLGLRRLGRVFTVSPCIPAAWPSYRLIWQVAGTRYEITVRNPNGRQHGVASATLDGQPVDFTAIPLADDGRAHQVEIVIG